MAPLVQLIASLFGTKPLAEPMLTYYCQLVLGIKIQEYTLEYVIYEMLAIFLGAQYVKSVSMPLY